MNSIIRQLLPPPEFLSDLASPILPHKLFQKPALTGHNGVLGKRLVERLNESGLNVEKCPGNICDKSLMESWLERTKPDVLFHFAAKVPTFWVMENYAAALEINAGATANLAKFCAQRGIYFVYASTSHVYAQSPNPRRELDSLRPISAYGETKLAGEFAVQRLCPQHLICRIFSFTAEDQSHSYLVPSLVRRLQSDLEVVVMNSAARRDILHADDIVFAVLHLASRQHSGIINICAGIPHTVGGIAQRLQEILNSRAKIILDGKGADDTLYGDATLLKATLKFD